jgi:uncharacterized protein YfdQ (DUF2303 family)
MDLQQAIEFLYTKGKESALPQGVQKLDGGSLPFFMTPTGPKAAPELIFNDYADRPQRIKSNIGVLDSQSFCEYFEAFSDPDSRVFAYEPNLTVTGIIDYHNEQPSVAPRWGQHRVTLTLKKSPEWERWKGSDNKHFTQQEFAEFLEQNAIDITNPRPADMMEVARDLQATTEVEFGAGVRMNDGQVRFKYTETTKSSVGASQLAVPEGFTISLPVFVGGSRVDMGALLRFRVKEGHLVIWYTLVRPEEVMRTAFMQSRDAIQLTLGVSGVTIINGQPAA